MKKCILLFLGALTILLPLQAQAKLPGLKATINSLIRKGQYDLALRKTASALREHPGDSSLRLLAAQTLYLRAVKKLQERGQVTSSVSTDLQMSLAQAGRILKDKPDNRDARLVKAQAHYLGNQQDQAKKEINWILEKNPGDGGANFLLATILFGDSGQLAQQAKVVKAAELRKTAAAHYRKALKAGTKRAECYRRLGDILTTDGNLDKALGYYKNALIRDHTQAPHRWLLQNCHPNKAIPVYRKGEQKHLSKGDKKGAAFLRMYIGFYQEKASEWKKARQSARRALELDPEGCWFCRYRDGWCSWWLEERKAAKKAFLQLLHDRRNQFCDYLRAIGAEGKTASAMIHTLAADALNAGQMADARDLSLLRAFVRGIGEDWNNFAFLCRETGKYEDAWMGYQRAIEKDPTNPRYLNDGALILHYHLRRDLDRARKLYKKAVAEAQKMLKSPETPPGKKTEARSALRDALGNLRKLQRQKEK